MKQFAFDFSHRLLLCSAIIAIVLGCALSVAKALLPWLPNHRVLIEHFVSNTLHQEVKINHIAIGWTRMQPFLQLQQVTICDLNPQHRPLLTLPEVDLQLNLLQSLWQQQLQFTRITFKNAQLHLYQDKALAWHLAGSESLSDFSDPNNTSHAFMGWLLSIHHLQLEAFSLAIEPQNWPSFSVKNVSIDFKNTGQRHQLFAKALLTGPSTASLSLAIHLNGSWRDFPNIDTKLYASIQPLDLRPWLAQKSWLHWQWQQGTIGGQLWATWQKNHWSSVQTSLHGTQLTLAQSALPHGWLIHSQAIDLRGSWQPDLTTGLWQGQLQSSGGQVGFGSLFRTNIPFTRVQAQFSWDNQLLSVPFLSLSTPDAIAQAKLKLQLAKNASPVIDLTAKAKLLNLNHASLYLPTGIMAPALVNWLDTSIKGGAGGDAQMVLRGPLHHFPFADHSGLMDIRGQLHGITLNYWPGWPTITDLDADCQFTHQGFRITSHHGIELGLPIDAIEAILPHYAAPALLQIKATTHSDLSQGIRFIQQSPLSTSLKALATSIATGPFQLKLQLNIPLENHDGIAWQGDIALAHGSLTWRDYPLNLTALQGQLHLSNDQVSSEHLHGQLWGSAISLNVHKALNDKRLQIDGTGVLDSQTLPKAWSFSFVRGSAPYKVQLALADQTSKTASEFWIQSALQGLELQLPSGFSKPAFNQAPLQIHGVLTNDGHLQRLDASCLLSKQAINATYQANPTNVQWQLTSLTLSAALVIPTPTRLPWLLTIDHFQWQAAPANSTATAMPFDFDVSAVPAMNIHATHLLFGKQMIHTFQAQLRPTLGGISIEDARLNSDLYQALGSGKWTNTDTQLTGTVTTKKLAPLLSSFDLPVFINSSDSQLHFALQWPGAPWQVDFAHLKGHLTATLASGSLPEVGNATSSGFGKILNLLSVNSLPQHLSFNFDDLSAKGFSFNSINGEFDLTHGQLLVPTLTVNSGIAEVAAHGCLNLTEQRYQLVMEVKPHLTSSLPIIAALAAGPIVGAVSLAANILISPTISKITSSNYLVTGPWASPSHQQYSSNLAASEKLHCQAFS